MIETLFTTNKSHKLDDTKRISEHVIAMSEALRKERQQDTQHKIELDSN